MSTERGITVSGSHGISYWAHCFFVPGRAETKILIEMFKTAQRRGFTAGLLPYGFHADTPPNERTFLIKGKEDPDPSRAGDLEYNH